MSKKMLPAMIFALLLGMLGVTIYTLRRVRELEKRLFDYPDDDIDDEFIQFDDGNIDDDDEFDDDKIKNMTPTEE